MSNRPVNQRVGKEMVRLNENEVDFEAQVEDRCHFYTEIQNFSHIFEYKGLATCFHEDYLNFPVKCGWFKILGIPPTDVVTSLPITDVYISSEIGDGFVDFQTAHLYYYNGGFFRHKFYVQVATGLDNIVLRRPYWDRFGGAQWIYGMNAAILQNREDEFDPHILGTDSNSLKERYVKSTEEEKKWSIFVTRLFLEND